MIQRDFDGNTVLQPPALTAPVSSAKCAAPSLSTASGMPKRLLSYQEFGHLIGASERKARDVAKSLGIVPVTLGPRCTKLLAIECEAALARLPRQVNASEPSQLIRGKIAKLKGGGKTVLGNLGVAG